MSTASGEPPVTQLTIQLQAPYQFAVRVEGDNVREYRTGEGPPLGPEGIPTPTDMLASAIATCLSSSLLFCTQKARVTIDDLSGRVTVRLKRNEKGRLRIGSIAVALDVTVPQDQRERFARCREIFEEFCVVTESVRAGIPVEVDLRVS